MPGLLGLFKNSPRLGGSRDLTPVSSRASGLAPASSRRSHKPPEPAPPQLVSLKFNIENPPLIMYGSPTESSGALMSGTLDLDVTASVDLMVATLRFVQRVTYKGKKPSENISNLEVIAQWDIVQDVQSFDAGTHEYPFSHLLPGALPPSLDHKYFVIEYYLDANVIIKGQTAPVTERLPMNIGRSVESVQDKTSMRLFPPTDMSLSMVLPTHIFPRGSFVAEMRIENLTAGMQDGRYVRWNVRKVTWKLVETTKMEVCGKEFETEDDIYSGQLKSGWKFDGDAGVAELLTREISNHTMDLAKDIHDTVLKLSVTHKLALEVLIGEESVADKHTPIGVPTGRARALRVQIGLSVVDAPGLGISWEDEVPPVYADVPLSPPNYDTSLVEIPNMVFSPLMPSFSPTLRDSDPSQGDMTLRPSVSTNVDLSSAGQGFIRRIKEQRLHGGDLRPVNSAPHH